VVRKIVLTGIVAFIVVFGRYEASAQTAAPLELTLDDAISMALEHNRDVLIARGELNKAAEQIREARSGAFPQISLNGLYTRTLQKPAFFLTFEGETQKISIGTDNSIQSNLNVNQVLYSAGRLGTAIRVSHIYSQSVSESIERAEKTAVFIVRGQFLGVLVTKEVVQVNRRNLELAEAHFENIKILNSKGAASDFDLLRAEVQAANTRPRLISSENDLILQMDMLKSDIGLPLDREILVTGELSPVFIDDEMMDAAEEQVFTNRSDYQALLLNREVNFGRVNIESAGKKPTISLSYNYQFQGQSNTFNFGTTNRVISQSASLNLSYPIFDGFRTSARIQQVKIDLQNIDFHILKLKEAIDIQITVARNKMTDARQRIEALARTVEQAQKAYQIALVRFDSGQGTQMELFDAQVALEMAQLNAIQSVYDYEMAKAEWEYAVGR
jgi:outer membrane protein TolC